MKKPDDDVTKISGYGSLDDNTTSLPEEGQNDGHFQPGNDAGSPSDEVKTPNKDGVGVSETKTEAGNTKTPSPPTGGKSHVTNGDVIESANLSGSKDAKTGSKNSKTLSSSVQYTPGSDKEVIIDDSETAGLVERHVERNLTNTEAILHLFKIFTGPSTIGMPVVMKNGGILFGLIGFLIIGYLATYGNILVVNCGRLLCRRTGVSSLRYEEMMELTMLSRSESKNGRLLAKIVKGITIMMLCLCQFGIISFYVEVIGTVLHNELLYADIGYHLPLIFTFFIVATLLIPYSWMKNLKVLSWFSLTANISILICVVTLFQYAWGNLLPITDLPLITPDPWTIPLFLSASVFTVEGVPMLLPIENRVRDPKAFGGLCGVITLASTFNIIINVTIGFYGYLCFGNDVPENILTALPDFWWYHVVSLLYGLMVFLTFTLQLFLIAEFVNGALQPRIDRDWFRKYGDIIIRTVFVLLAYLTTIVISNIQLIMSLTGAFCSVPLLFFFPAIGEMILLRKEKGGVPFYVYIRDIFMILVGVSIFVSGTFMSVVNIVQRLQG